MMVTNRFMYLIDFCVSYIKYIIYNVQDYSVLYNNAVRPVICESKRLTYMWKTLAGRYHFTKMGGLMGPQNWFNPTILFIEVQMYLHEARKVSHHVHIYTCMMYVS